MLLLDCGGRDLPESVHLDISGVIRKRIRAAWNGNTFTPEDMGQRAVHPPSTTSTVPVTRLAAGDAR